MRISDLAIELCQDIDCSSYGVTLDITESKGVRKSLTHITNAKGAKKVGKPIGTYCNIEVEAITEKNMDEITKVLGETLAKFIEKPTKILVVGLGNSHFVADSLGPKTCANIAPEENLVTFAPGVLGTTGIPSTTAIHAITRAINPSHVLVVDTLCCHDRARLGNNFQVSDSGITPGSGVGRDNQCINREFLGVPVIAAGVPLVIFEPSLHYVVPKTIDMVVAACAQIISSAIHKII